MKIELIQKNNIEPSIFDDKKNYIILNQKLSTLTANSLTNKINIFFEENPLSMGDSFILLASSGTTSFKIKLVALKKMAILNSAHMVGQHFSFKKNENWLTSLPCHHIGGLSILARSHLFKQRTFAFEKWDLALFSKIITDYKINYCSLVPTQVFDIVQKVLQAPVSIKKVFVGGGHLDETIFIKATQLGWPLIKTYGMTETSSMIAYSDSKENLFTPFNEIKISTNSESKLTINCNTLYTCTLKEGDNGNIDFEFPKLFDNFWQTEDIVSLTSQGKISFIGRGSDFTKIKGELINLFLLRQRLNSLSIDFLPSITNSTIIEIPHQRDGSELIAFFEAKPQQNINKSINKILNLFNNSVLPFEKIFSYVLTDKFPLTEIGKLKLSEFNTSTYKELINEKRSYIME
ncbi:MAG: AMP-binding protein [Bdellovibrionaceae bacterium]|nr:AMP-binding protein [Pseudobdellovibrionaceae bacterium]NUM57139.1 AMP-binding protein [Pseudobdellovibrionaceae bacterium]